MSITQIRRGNLYVAMYLVAAMMIALPFGELAFAAWPLRLGAIQWRFGVVGLFGNAFLGPMTGIVLLAVLAALLEHRVFLRVVATLALLLTLVTASGWVVFVLDALQLRGAVKPQSLRGFEVAAVKALLGLSCATLLGLWVGIAGWRATRTKASTQKVAKTVSPRSVLIGTPAIPTAARQVEREAAGL
jgi:hypothetical protein